MGWGCAEEDKDDVGVIAKLAVGLFHLWYFLHADMAVGSAEFDEGGFTCKIFRGDSGAVE